jgi:hypothetical protein
MPDMAITTASPAMAVSPNFILSVPNLSNIEANQSYVLPDCALLLSLLERLLRGPASPERQ